MTINDFRKLMTSESLQDLWWLALDDLVLDEQLSLEKIQAIRAKKPKSVFSVLNIAYTEEAGAAWLDFDDTTETKSHTTAANTVASGGSVAEEIRQLREQVSMMNHFIQHIHKHFISKENLELKEIELKEREKFLEESEEALLMKIQQQEEQMAELEQMKEDDEVERPKELRAI